MEKEVEMPIMTVTQLLQHHQGKQFDHCASCGALIERGKGYCDQVCYWDALDREQQQEEAVEAFDEEGNNHDE